MEFICNYVNLITKEEFKDFLFSHTKRSTGLVSNGHYVFYSALEKLKDSSNMSVGISSGKFNKFLQAW